MKSPLYPLKFDPVYKAYLWGGSRIAETYRPNLPPGIYAESWEISDHDDGMSVISNGPWRGQTFRAILTHRAQEILGTKVQGTRFPLLIKLLDAKKRLSLQVHPDEKAAIQFGGKPKTEAWYVLGESPSTVFCGLKPGTDSAQFEAALKSKEVEQTLQYFTPKPGTVISVPSKRIHAILEGSFLFEVQQNANTTYRVYDWDRKDAEGHPRELHLEAALKTIRWDDDADPIISPQTHVSTEGISHQEWMLSRHFRLEKISFSVPVPVSLSGKTFHALFVEKGSGFIEWEGGREELNAGESLLVPAGLKAYQLTGQASVLRITLPV